MELVDHIREQAFRESGRQSFMDEPVDVYQELFLHKAAGADDRALLARSADLPGDTLEVYEALGGTYKTAGWASKAMGAGGKKAPAATDADLKELLKMERDEYASKKKTAAPLWRKLAFGTPMFQPMQTAVPGMQGSAAGAGGMKGMSPKPMGMGGMGGAKSMIGGAGSGSTNPMAQATTPQIPGAGSPKTGSAKEAGVVDKIKSFGSLLSGSKARASSAAAGKSSKAAVQDMRAVMARADQVSSKPNVTAKELGASLDTLKASRTKAKRVDGMWAAADKDSSSTRRARAGAAAGVALTAAGAYKLRKKKSGKATQST